MAGIFGFLDFTKNGPGVEKNAPEKRAGIVFLEIFGRKIWQLIQAGLLFFVVNIPLITRGWADVGLAFITRSFSREKHAFVREDFFGTIKKNRKQAFVVGLINQVVTGVLLYNLYSMLLYPFVYALLGKTVEPVELSFFGLVVLMVTVLIYVVFTFMKYYIPFLVITFPLSTGQVYKNALIFTVAGLKENLLISLVLGGIYALLVFLAALLPYAIVYGLIALFLLFVFPGFRSLLIQFCIFPVIKRLMIDPYYEKNPDADKQARLDLNLDVPAEPGEDEPIFREAPAVEPAKDNLPKQYSEQEIRSFRNRIHPGEDEEEDTTI